MFDLKGHTRSKKTTCIKICMNANVMKRQFVHECHFYVMEKFCDFFT